jgi:cytochrome c2
MKKTIIWSAVVVVLLLIIFIITRNTNNPTDSKTKTAERLYSSLGCATCHGSDMSGTEKGPELTDLGEYWTRDYLVMYLNNTTAFIDSARMVKYQNKYKGFIMHSYDTVDVDELQMLADYLIKQ